MEFPYVQLVAYTLSPSRDAILLCFARLASDNEGEKLGKKMAEIDRVVLQPNPATIFIYALVVPRQADRQITYFVGFISGEISVRLSFLR